MGGSTKRAIYNHRSASSNYIAFTTNAPLKKINIITPNTPLLTNYNIYKKRSALSTIISFTTNTPLFTNYNFTNSAPLGLAVKIFTNNTLFIFSGVFFAKIK